MNHLPGISRSLWTMNIISYAGFMVMFVGIAIIVIVGRYWND
jgi:hypothetical protein